MRNTRSANRSSRARLKLYSCSRLHIFLWPNHSSNIFTDATAERSANYQDRCVGIRFQEAILLWFLSYNIIMSRQGRYWRVRVNASVKYCTYTVTTLFKSGYLRIHCTNYYTNIKTTKYYCNTKYNIQYRFPENVLQQLTP